MCYIIRQAASTCCSECACFASRCLNRRSCALASQARSHLAASVHSYDATNNPRILTILYYLNGKGATWFPLADDPQGGSFSTHAEAVSHSAALDPAVDGLRVEPTSAGDALAFYNFVEHAACKGEPDPYTLHAGLEVAATEDKWIGTRKIQIACARSLDPCA